VRDKYEMVDSSSVAFREGDKLKGFPNYYVWALKIRVMLRTEGQWIVTKTEHSCYISSRDRRRDFDRGATQEAKDFSMQNTSNVS